MGYRHYTFRHLIYNLNKIKNSINIAFMIFKNDSSLTKSRTNFGYIYFIIFDNHC